MRIGPLLDALAALHAGTESQENESGWYWVRLLDRKAKGQEVTVQPPTPERRGKVVDIFAALKHSREQAAIPRQRALWRLHCGAYERWIQLVSTEWRGRAGFRCWLGAAVKIEAAILFVHDGSLAENRCGPYRPTRRCASSAWSSTLPRQNLSFIAIGMRPKIFPIIHCPNCKSTIISRSHRQGLLERLLRFAWIRPYRCGKCGRRFWARRR